MTTTEDVIKSAAAVARDAAEGRLNSAALDAAVADECRESFGVVAGPEDDPLWPLHVDIARQVLALGGVSADELTEWTAVARRREQPEGAADTEQAVRPVDESEAPPGNGFPSPRRFVSERGTQPRFGRL